MPQGPFNVDTQRQLSLSVMKLLGFNFDNGRVDVSAHPFCGGVPEDVRITTRYNEKEFLTALLGIVHETGHARYEQNLPRDLLGQPVARPVPPLSTNRRACCSKCSWRAAMNS